MHLSRGSHAGAWATVWAAVGALTAGAALTIWSNVATATDTTKHLPLWPAFFFGALAVVCLALALAPTFSYWPYGRPFTKRPAMRAAEREFTQWVPETVGVRDMVPGEEGLVLLLSAPPRLGLRRRSTASLRLRRVEDGMAWGPINPRRNGRTYVAFFPRDFSGATWPITEGLYRGEWSTNNVRVTDDFILRLGRGTAWADLYKPPATALRRSKRRLVERLLRINAGFAWPSPEA